MKMKNSFGFIICLFISVSVYPQNETRKTILLDEGWKFSLGENKAASTLDFNDSTWETVSVPHDRAIRKPFDLNQDMQWVQVKEDGDKEARLRTGRTGALPIFGVGWYRKTIEIPESDLGKRVFVEFDGAMSQAKVYCNGEFVGEWPYGYSSFSFELTGFIKPGIKNVLAVRLENKPESSRWYSGAGIYRNVRLLIINPIHVAHWGTYITTPEITAKKATLYIQTKLINQSNVSEKVELVTEIFSSTGEKVANSKTTKQVNAEEQFDQTIQIKNPVLWDVASPTKYKAVTNVFVGEKLVDTYETSFGIRSIRFDKDKGFVLNEKHMKLQGVCLHHDLGPLGAAVNYRATERQLEILKEMGCNAIRTSHNPPSPELLELCDKMGFVVMVESFDEWKLGKNVNGYNRFFKEWAENDMVSMIHRDRNHPSVVMWSIGNEIGEQDVATGKSTAKFLVDICHREDPTRPTTAGFDRPNGAIKNGLTDVVDLVGFNYKPHLYQKVHQEHPNYVLFGSETASTLSSRGVYKFPAKVTKSPWYDDYQTSSYDLEFPGWASIPDTEFEKQDECDFILGEFVWTGFDYLGEPTPYNEGTPAKSSYFGIVDLAGLKKDRFYLYQSRWSSKPVLHLLPHWNWEEKKGDTVPVFCYTNYPKVELFVNGKSMGVKSKSTTNNYEKYRLMWNNITYQPGEIKAVAYENNGNIAATQIIKTVGKPAKIKLTADRTTITADGKDLSFVTVEITDNDGNLCPNAQRLLFFKTQGEGSLKALCNGDPTDLTSFSSNYMKAFNGKMVAIISSTKLNGKIKLVVSGERLENNEIEINTK
ncbi:MAG: beta-galactosidase GalB [Bacteroidota bacterium]|nr:beta-galactosidase GalB [Bacteroidota bacterium]